MTFSELASAREEVVVARREVSEATAEVIKARRSVRFSNAFSAVAIAICLLSAWLVHLTDLRVNQVRSYLDACICAGGQP